MAKVARRKLRKFTSFDEFVSLVELEDVLFLECAARRLTAEETEEAEEQEQTEESKETDVELPSQEAMQVWLRSTDEGRGLDVRCRITLRNRHAAFVADAVATFVVSGEPFELAESLERQFIDRVAITVVYPYLRESITASATKLRVDIPVLSLRNPWRADESDELSGPDE